MTNRGLFDIIFNMSGLLTKITNFLSGDLLFLLAVFIVTFLSVVYFNKSRILSLILAFYPTAFLYNQIPFFNKLIVLNTDIGKVLNKLGIFLILFIIISIVINKHTSSYGDFSGFINKIGLTTCILILFMVFSYTIIDLSLFHNFSSSIDALFMGEGRAFGWSLLPFVILTFI